MASLKTSATLWICLVAVAAALFAREAAGATARELQVPVSSAKVITFREAARSVFIADPAIADIQVASPTSVIVFGRKPGQTTLIAIGQDEAPLATTQIVVRHDYNDLRRMVLSEVPASNLKVTPTPTGLVLSGTVPNNETAEKIVSVALRYAGDKEPIINNLEVVGPPQVNLRVRVAEVSRTVTKQLGFNWDAFVAPGSFAFAVATGRPFNAAFPGLITRATPLAGTVGIPSAALSTLNTNRLSLGNIIDVLAEEGVIKILAQPNLTAISGQPASFLAGGEFPIPVAQSGDQGERTITVQFKEFGVKLAFVPTVLSSDRIAIKVRPEVSQLSTQGAITIGDLTIPALSTRRAETTIQLGSGESFAIAGLIQNDTTATIDKVPGLGDLPVIGSLFRSSRFQRNETELVIIVTPYVVRPVADGPSLRLPSDGHEPSTDIERILLDRLTKPSVGAAHAVGVGGARLRGDAGFIFR